MTIVGKLCELYKGLGIHEFQEGLEGKIDGDEKVRVLRSPACAIMS